MRDAPDIELQEFRDQDRVKQTESQKQNSMEQVVDASDINLQQNPDEYFEGREVAVESEWGNVAVTVVGHPDGIPCITCYAVGTDWQLCFDDLIIAADDKSLLHQVCFYHIDYAGYAEGGGLERKVSSDGDEEADADFSSTRAPDKPPSQEYMLGRIHAVVKHLQLQDALAFGVGFGGHVLVHYAAQHPEVVLALICIGLPIKAPRFQENNWGQFILKRNRWAGCMHQMSSRLFSPQQIEAWSAADMDLANWYHRQLVRLPSRRVFAHLSASLQRADITQQLLNLKCRVLLISGTDCMYHEDAVQLHAQANHSRIALQKVEHCGLLCMVEAPDWVTPSIDLFLQGLEAERHAGTMVTASPLTCITVT